jgi:invasion protein IalB
MMCPTRSVALKTCLLSVIVAVSPVLAQQPSTHAPSPGNIAPAKPAPPETIQMIFSEWAKYCTKGLSEQSSEITAKEVCFTAADGHLASGQKLVIALLIEPKASETKFLRVTLPLGVALVPGARIVIDETAAMTAPFVACMPKNGCMADYKADADLIENLKKGQSLAIQAFDKGKPISFTLPLAGFAKAYDGPAGDPGGLQESLSSDVH